MKLNSTTGLIIFDQLRFYFHSILIYLTDCYYQTGQKLIFCGNYNDPGEWLSNKKGRCKQRPL